MVRSIGLPLLEFLTSQKFWTRYKELKRTQWLRREKIEQLQVKKARRLLRHAYETVPMYHQIFKEGGFHPNDFTNINDLLKIPVITKEEMTKNFPKRTVSKKTLQKELVLDSTSGSTGEPFTFFLDKYKKDYREAFRVRNREWAGNKFGEKYFLLWGIPITGDIESHLFWKFLERSSRLSLLKMDYDSMRSYVKRIKKSKVNLLVGYASALLTLAEFVMEGNIEISIPSVISSAETLSPQARKTIETVFNCRVFDRYGTREFGDMAQECEEREGLHVYDEGFIIEIERNGEHVSEGESGEILITDLDNFSMPFIRYRIGDIGTSMENGCSCGRGLSMMKKIEGRTLERAISPIGTVITGPYFTLIFDKHFSAFSKFQIVEESKGSIKVLLVKGPTFTDFALSEVMKEIEDYCAGMKVSYKFVKNIPRERSGKYRILKAFE